MTMKPADTAIRTVSYLFDFSGKDHSHHAVYALHSDADGLHATLAVDGAEPQPVPETDSLRESVLPNGMGFYDWSSSHLFCEVGACWEEMEDDVLQDGTHLIELSPVPDALIDADVKSRFESADSEGLCPACGKQSKFLHVAVKSHRLISGELSPIAVPKGDETLPGSIELHYECPSCKCRFFEEYDAQPKRIVAYWD